GVGRFCLSLEEERAVAGKERIRLCHSSEEAEGTADERGDVAGQWTALEDPGACRASLCPSEGADEPVRSHHRPGPRPGEDWHGQSRLQHAALGLARGARCARVMARGTKAAAPTPKSA